MEHNPVTSGQRIKDYNLGDTIAAIATFPAKSALGVIKISGKKSIPMVARIFKPSRKKNLRKARTYTLHYGWIIDRINGSTRGRRNPQTLKPRSPALVDEVLVSIMKKPHSYTTEDVVEISCHGGLVAVNRILELLLAEGARLALPGEFTYRALVGGRIDLLQAESIAGIVDAKTSDSLALAVSQLNGENSRMFARLKTEVKDLYVHTESLLNFPEEDSRLSLPELAKKVEAIAGRLARLCQGSKETEIMREGLRCVICGSANVGKSTLFNRLLGQERVIVSHLPGTTRDVVEEFINIRGVPLRMYDTAGILEPGDLVSRKAIEKTRQIFEAADMVILLLDASRRLNANDLFLLHKIGEKQAIVVMNKIDLPQKISSKDLPPLDAVIVKMSALKNIGLARFEKAVFDRVYQVGLDRENLIFLNYYQRSVLENVTRQLREIKGFLNEGHTLDFVNLGLGRCLEELGKVNGTVLTEEILENIFSRFCIGK